MSVGHVIITAEGVTTTCRECGRVFDLLDPTEGAEAAYGHDCEAAS